MHADETATDAALVRRLITTQLPAWGALPVEAVRASGTDHAIYRLGDDMAVRMPRTERAAVQVDKEHRWLPVLAPRLPLPVPLPLAKGAPGEGFPWSWSVCRWLEGTDATTDRPADGDETARDLARFVSALWRCDPSEGPTAGPHNFFRGAPLALRDSHVRIALGELATEIDADAAAAEWDAALEAPAWHGPPTWLHGDLTPGNLLVSRGRICAVIDFGGLGVGDPACDLIVAWNLLPRSSRAVFRSALAVDDATWARGRGWALSIGLIALPYYLTTNAAIVEWSRRMIREVLEG